jgi:hypothetical protein
MNNLAEIEGKSKDPMWQRLFKSNRILKEIYANRMNRLRTSSMYNTNAAFKARVNALNSALRAMGMNENRPAVRYRKQEGDTCWFHAIVNGLIMSKRPREIMAILTNNVPDDNRRNYSFCPMRNASKDVFWRYIKHRIGSYGRVNNSYRNVNVIKSSGVRGVVNRIKSMFRRNTGNGTAHDVLNFYKKMFSSEFFKLKAISAGKNATETHSPGYTLTHSWIGLIVGTVNTTNNSIEIAGGHSVCGYVTPSGNYKIYDSMNDKIYDVDWRKLPEHFIYSNTVMIPVGQIAIYTKT